MVTPQEQTPPVDSKTDPTKADPKIVPPTIQTPPIKPTDDPLVLEYAADLKAQLGDLYEKEYDALDLKERINVMKIIKKTMEKIPKRSEGKAPIAPEPDTIIPKVKTHYERFAAGDTGLGKGSAFQVTMNK